jgi:protein involved in polysaccharide export with SLBB domain
MLLTASPAWAQRSGEGQSMDQTGSLSSDQKLDTANRLGEGGEATVPLAGPIDPEIYRLGPGDVLLIQLWGRVSRIFRMVVGPEGSIVVQGGESVMVAGRTLADVRTDLIGRLRPQFRGVDVDVRLDRPRTFIVYLSGEVQSPGPVPVVAASRVSHLLAGASLPEKASRRQIQVLHMDGSRETADLELFMRTGDQSLDPWLRDGDVIHVPQATEFCYVQGAVARPGRYELGGRDSLRTLLTIAGDPLPAALVDSALYIRFVNANRSESTWVSLEGIYSGTQNEPVDDGTRLYVYFVPEYRQQDEAVVQGEVARPGSYPIQLGVTRLHDLVHAAGGFRPGADLSAIRLTRRNPASGDADPELDRLLRLSRNELTDSEYEILRTKLAGLREEYRVDWNRISSNPNLDLLLRSGDVVRVTRLVSSIRVEGEVRRPGIVNFIEGRGPRTYIDECGGFTDRAWIGKMRITRAVTGQTLLARNVSSLDPGDLIWVPERPDRTVWEQLRDVVTVAGSIATVIIAIRSVQ